MKQKPVFPANVIAYVRQELNRRTMYKTELERLVPPPEWAEVKYDRYLLEKKKLDENIEQLTNAIIAITQKHLPVIEIDLNPEITIANILAAMPTPQEVRRVTQVSARGQS